MIYNVLHYIDVERNRVYSAKVLLNATMKSASKKNVKQLRKLKKELQICEDTWLIIRNTVEINEKKQKEVLEKFQKLQIVDVL